MKRQKRSLARHSQWSNSYVSGVHYVYQNVQSIYSLYNSCPRWAEVRVLTGKVPDTELTKHTNDMVAEVSFLPSFFLLRNWDLYVFLNGHLGLARKSFASVALLRKANSWTSQLRRMHDGCAGSTVYIHTFAPWFAIYTSARCLATTRQFIAHYHPVLAFAAAIAQRQQGNNR